MFYQKFCLERQVYQFFNSTEIPFQSFKIPFKFTFHGFFPLRKIIFFEVGLFFIQWMLKTNIPTSPFPLWEHMIRSKRDILLLHLNNLQTVYCQNKGSLFCASLSCVFKKKLFLWSCQCKITERHDPRRWAAILSIASWNLTSDTML